MVLVDLQDLISEPVGLNKIRYRHPLDKINEPKRVITALSPLDVHLDIDRLAEVYNATSLERLDTEISPRI